MEKRRVQLVGRSTLTVSLPTAWVKKVGLTKGDVIRVAPEKDGSLRIITSSMALVKEVSKICTINSDLCQEGDSIGRLIVAGYVGGSDIIRITAKNRISSENIQEVRDAELRLMGLSIVEETPTSMTLQCSINPTIFPINVVIRRLHTLFSIMCDEAIQALKDSNLELAEEAQRREREANRMYALILRLLNQAQTNPTMSQKIGMYDAGEILDMSRVATALEGMADWADNIAEEVRKTEIAGVGVGEKTKASIEDYSRKIRDLSYKAMKSVFAFDADLANKLIRDFEKNLDTEAYRKIEDLTLSTSFFEACLLRRIIWNLRRIGEIAVSIAETAIDRAMEKEGFCSIEPSELATAVTNKSW